MTAFGRTTVRASLVLGTLCATAAGADDWPQFRHDSRRTGASTDRTILPLIEIWSASRLSLTSLIVRERRKDMVVWQDGVYFIIPEKGRRVLTCVDLRTGAPRWQRPLAAMNDLRPQFCSNELGTPATWVAAANSGVIYAYERRRAYPMRNASPDRANFCVVAFEARTGAPLSAHVPYTGYEDPRAGADVVTKVLLEVPGPAVVQDYFRPGSSWQRAMADPKTLKLINTRNTSYWGLPFAGEGLGPPLIIGNQLIATGAEDLFFRWSRGSTAQHLRLVVPGDFTVQARFTGYPMAQAPGGIVIGDDQWVELVPGSLRTRTFLALLNPGAYVNHYLRWLRTGEQWPWTMGIPAVSGNVVFTGYGGAEATDGVIALDSVTGATRWTFPPEGVAPEGATGGQGVISAKFVSHIDVPGSDVPVRESKEEADAAGVRRGAGAWTRNPGLVVTGGRVFGMVRQHLVALEEGSGKPIWSVPVPERAQPLTIVGSKNHLFACMRLSKAPRESCRLVAHRMTDGKEVWRREMLYSGALIPTNGLLLFSDGSAVHGLAPPERTFRMGVDTDRPDAYWLPPEKQEGAEEPHIPPPSAPEPEGVEREGMDEKEAKPVPVPPEKAVADATVLRLSWSEAPEGMLRKIQARRRVAPDLPLLLSLDWLDGSRSRMQAGEEALLERCRVLAAAGRPEHFDVAPEVNVYLTRYPDQLPAVRDLVRRLRRAVQQASPATKVLVSFNLEVLTSRYGKRDYMPFGIVESPVKRGSAWLAPLAEEVEELGVTSYPQAGFARPSFATPDEKWGIPGDYLLSIRELVPQKPVLVTRLGVRPDPKSPTAVQDQADTVTRLMQLCYWLDSPLVAYPELEGGSEFSLRGRDGEQPGLARWRATLGWRWVKQLSLAARRDSGFGAGELMPE